MAVAPGVAYTQNREDERVRMDTPYVDRSVLCASPGGLHRVAYREWGGRGVRGDEHGRDKPVLLCLHGLTRNGRDFDALGAALGGEFRVVCPDLPGRGRSDWLPDPGGYGLEQYVSDMMTLIARLDVERVGWLGTSLGGLVGMCLAGHPEAPIERLLLNDIGPRLEAAALRRIGDYLGRAPAFADEAEAERYVRRVSAPFGTLSDADWRHLTQVVLRRTLDGGYELNFDPAIAESFRRATDGGGSDLDLWSSYEKIVCPTLLVRGAESDLLSRATVRRMAACGPRPQCIEIAGVGHAPMFIVPEQIALAHDFFRPR